MEVLRDELSSIYTYSGMVRDSSANDARLAPGFDFEVHQMHLKDWTDLREDKKINQAQGFRPMFGPLGPTAGPGSPGNGPGSKNSTGCTKDQPRKPILSPTRGHFCVFGPTAKIHKYK